VQLGELQRALGEFQSRGIVLVAISVDPPDRSKAVVTRLGLTFPLLSDRDRLAVESFGVEDVENGVAWPAVFVLEPGGTVRWRSLSDDYRNRPTPEDILAALEHP
jgi:peroxiredoxin